jgi:peptidoglycan/LPS O-acetylase OafA/YrhL
MFSPRGHKSSRLDALTSLRLMAALVVVVHHARGFLIPDSFVAPAREAVSFFFVLSGFILTFVYHRRPYSLKSYYIARIARILPVTLLSIAVFVVLINPFSFDPSSPLRPNFAITASNIFLLQSLIPIPSYYFGLNAVLWSVSVEVVFYLLFPALERSLRSPLGRVLLFFLPVLIGVLLIAISTLYNFPDYSYSAFTKVTWHGLIYINPLSRLKEFTFGMLAGLVFTRINLARLQGKAKTTFITILEVLALISLVWGLPFLNWLGTDISSRIGGTPLMLEMYTVQVLTGALFAVIILLFAIEGGLISRLLRNKAIVIGGEISFSVYLFHQTMILWQHRNPWILGWCPSQLKFPVLLVVTFAISYVAWKWFERPMRNLMRRIFDCA